MSLTELNSVSFKTTSFKTNIVLNLIIGILLISLSALILKNLISSDYLIIVSILIGVILSPIITGFISNDETTVSIENGQLFLITETSLLSKTHENSFPTQEIKCYELSESKYYTFLVFYFHNRKPYFIVLGKKAMDTSVLLNTFFTKNEILSIKTTKHLTNETFKKRFFNTLIFNCLFFAVLLSVHYSVLLYYKLQLGAFFQINFKYMASLVLSAGLLYYLMLDKKWGSISRFGNISGCTYLTIFAIGIVIGFSSKKLNSLIAKEVSISNVNEIKNYTNDLFFKVDNYQFSQNNISYKQDYSKNSKSSTYTITNTFKVPFENQSSNETIEYQSANYWLEYSFSHKSKNVNPDKLSSTVNDDYKTFSEILNNKIDFFELNKTSDTKDSNNEIVYQSYILEPHFTNFSDFKQNEKTHLFYFLIGAFAICCLNSFILARAR